MFVRKKTYRVVRDALTLAESVIGRRDNTIARLQSELSLREDDLRRARGRLKDALDKSGDEPPELDLSLSFAE